ncbi:MAG: hypothetical protein OZ921_19555 [Sorangiineae bacterium]|nr:hypothetical protein [Polyangiaceae bacterium]MEB2324721.1 hypothetical protein [Sorangiineae bacterium]
MNLASRALPLIGLLSLAGCFDVGSTGGSSAIATLVAVDPADFLGAVPCADAPGAMRRYVATIVDVTPGLDEAGAAEFALPSTGPVSCFQQAAQGGAFVVPGHWYVADVQGYDRTELVPLGPGSPVMLDPETREVVPPRWATSCGRGAPTDAGASGASGEPGQDAVYAVAYRSVFARHCAPLTASGPATPTAVRVALEAGALGRPDAYLECGDAPGAVATFSAHDTRGSAPDQQTTCGASLLFDGLTPNERYRFRVEAFEDGAGAARWATSCSAQALAGATVTATCDPLTDRGGVTVDIPALLGRLGVACADLSSVTTLVQGAEPRTALQLPPDCEAPVVFDRLAAGTYQLGVRATLAGGAPGPSASCTAIVAPAATTTASCLPD